jgi:hypothetical protein
LYLGEVRAEQLLKSELTSCSFSSQRSQLGEPLDVPPRNGSALGYRVKECLPTGRILRALKLLQEVKGVATPLTALS